MADPNANPSPSPSREDTNLENNNLRQDLSTKARTLLYSLRNIFSRSGENRELPIPPIPNGSGTPTQSAVVLPNANQPTSSLPAFNTGSVVATNSRESANLVPGHQQEIVELSQIKTSKRYRSLSPDRPRRRRNWDGELNLPPDTRTINPWTAASMPGEEEEDDILSMPAHKRKELMIKAREAKAKAMAMYSSTIGSPVQERRGVDLPLAMGGTGSSRNGVDLEVQYPANQKDDGVEHFPPFEGHSVSRHQDRKFPCPDNVDQMFVLDDKPRGQTRGHHSKRGKTTGTSKSKPQAASASVDADGNQMMAGSNCANCGGVHDEQDCTEPCGACGRSGHRYNDCRIQQDMCRCKPFPCHLKEDCKQRCHKRNGCVDSTGHRAVQCTYRCVICGKFGHPAMKCQYFCPCRKDHFGLEHVGWDKKKDEFIDPGCMVVGCGKYSCDEHCMECGQPPHPSMNCPFSIRKDWTRGTRPRPLSSRSKTGTVRTLLCTTHESSSFLFGQSCEKCQAEKNRYFERTKRTYSERKPYTPALMPTKSSNE